MHNSHLANRVPNKRQSVKRLSIGPTTKVRFLAGIWISLFDTTSQLVVVPTQPPIQVQGTLSLGIDQPEYQANHSLYLVPRLSIRGALG
jgi:hypothetical protein